MIRYALLSICSNILINVFFAQFLPQRQQRTQLLIGRFGFPIKIYPNKTIVNIQTTIATTLYIKYFGKLTIQTTIINTIKSINRTIRQKVSLSLNTISKNTINVR